MASSGRRVSGLELSEDQAACLAFLSSPIGAGDQVNIDRPDFEPLGPSHDELRPASSKTDAKTMLSLEPLGATGSGHGIP